MNRKTYHIDYRRDGRFWIATVRGVRTPYGRQQDFEDSPTGWPQKPTYP